MNFWTSYVYNKGKIEFSVLDYFEFDVGFDDVTLFIYQSLLHKLDLLLPVDLMKQFIPVFKDHVNYSKESSITPSIKSGESKEKYHNVVLIKRLNDQ